MNYYNVTIISTCSVYTQEGREILKDVDTEITLRGVREEDLYHFISPEPEKRYKGVSAGDLKSILLIDTPKSCRECYFQKGLTVYGYACGLENKMNEDARCRPDWCPLIPFPKRHIAPKTATGYEIGYEDGWNECLEKMMRGAKRKDGF